MPGPGPCAEWDAGTSENIIPALEEFHLNAREVDHSSTLDMWPCRESLVWRQGEGGSEPSRAGRT